jgi:hypothetical protein
MLRNRYILPKLVLILLFRSSLDIFQRKIPINLTFFISREIEELRNSYKISILDPQNFIVFVLQPQTEKKYKGGCDNMFWNFFVFLENSPSNIKFKVRVDKITRSLCCYIPHSLRFGFYTKGALKI